MEMKTNNKYPVAVLISDIHFTVATLELAAVSFLRAQFKAKILGVPLIVMGDTLDSKAVMRAECVNRLLQLVSVKDAPQMIFVVGNHDLVNEKSKDHSLNFLKPYATVIDKPQFGYCKEIQCLIIPYQADPDVIKSILEDKEHPAPRLILMHQGIDTADSGDYIQDKTAIPAAWVSNFRVISGHYHARQDIKTGKDGLFSYCGNPYTLTFGEAHDPAKGYQILYNDYTLEFVPTNLRKHIIHEADNVLSLAACPKVTSDDLLWIKITGDKEFFAKCTKKYVAGYAGLDHDFRLELIPRQLVTNTDSTLINTPKDLALDSVIDNISTFPADKKKRLKDLWRNLNQ